MIPLSGVLMRWLSTRVAFVISCVGFTLASLGCALATSIEQLIVLRAIQGFMGGAMIPITQAISFSIFPRRAMGTVQGVIGMVVTLAPSIGPTVGGYLTEIFSWHWLFLINVIPGICVSLAVWRFLDVDKGDPSVGKRLDFRGLILIALFLGSLEFVLEEGPGDDWFASDLIIGMTLLCAASCIGFFWRVLHYAHPIVNLRAFKSLNFSVGAGLVFVVGVAMYGLVYLMPLFLGGVRGYSSLQIGEVMFVTGVTMFFTAPVVGSLTNSLDLRVMLFVGLALVGVGTAMNANLTSESGFWQFFWPQVVRGMGLIMCMIPASRIAMGSLGPAELGNAAGLFSVMRNLGGAIGLAILDTVRDWRVDYHWNQLTPALDAGRLAALQEIQRYQAMLVGHVADPYHSAVALLGQRLGIQAQVLAYNDIFLWLGVIYLLCVPLVFLLKRIDH